MMRTSFNIAILGLLMATGLHSSARPLNILTCEPEWQALALQIAPDSKIYSATSALQDPHHIQARPGLIAKMRNADLAICSGAELEVGWLPLLQKKSTNASIQNGKDGMFFAAEQVETIGKREHVDPTMGDVHPQGNPHLHLDPYRLMNIASALTKRMIRLNPDKVSAYQQNLDQFIKHWKANIQHWEQQAKPLMGMNVVAYHTSFEYLFRWLGINMVGDLEPKPGLPPSGKHLSDLLKLAKSTPIDAVIYASYQDKSGAEWLSKQIDVPAIKLPMSVDGNSESKNLEQLYNNLISKMLQAATHNG